MSTTAEFFDAIRAGDLARVELLLGADPLLTDAVSDDGVSPLGLAASSGQPEVLEFLLKSGADPNAAPRDEMGVTPLHLAVAHQQPEKSLQMATALLLSGADPNVQQHGGWTPLHEAAALGRAKILVLLLDHGANPNAVTADGKTPGQKAREAGHREIATRLHR